MASKKPEYPEEGELVLGTVESIFKQGAFITLDEYGGKKGLLHLSEISLKWVRNIRDYVKEGQKVVLLVLGVNPERGHIDLSLRRVTEAQKKEKLQEIKQKQRGRKLLELAAKEFKLSESELDKIEEEITEKFGSLYSGLEMIASDNSKIEQLDIRQDLKPGLSKLISNNIKAPTVTITGYVELKSYAASGVDDIKAALSRMVLKEKDCIIDVSYISAPIYRLKATAGDYKTAERALKNAAEAGIAYLHEHNGFGEYYRKLPEKTEK